MKKLVIVLAVIAMAFGMSSCSKKGGANPTEATKAYYECLKKGDFKAAVGSTYDYNKEMTAEEKDAVDAMLDMTADKIKEAMDAKGGMKDFVVSNESVNGEIATVDVKITYGNGEEEEKTEYLKKVGEKWFVADAAACGATDFSFDEEEEEEEIADEEIADEE